MEINVTGRHLEITPAIRDFAHQKVAKLPRYYDRITAIEVVADRTDHHDHYEVELIVQVERTDPFVVKVAGADLYACVDETVDKMERQLTDHKEKLRNRKHPKP
jgi:putative sigma-54 modulation protein